MCLQEIVNEALKHIRIKLGESATERVEAVPEGTAAKRRSIDAHRAVRDHRVEFAVIEHGISGNVHCDLLLRAETVGRKEINAPLPINDVPDVLGEEGVDGLHIHHQVRRLGRGVPKAQIVEPDADRSMA